MLTDQPRGAMWTVVRRIVRGLMASACVGMLLASCSVVMSFEPSPQDDGKAPPKAADKKAGAKGKRAEGGEARKKSQAQAKAKAARKQNRGDPDGGEGPKGPLPPRPERVVTPPSLTPADLDGLIKQFLTSTAPKVEPATVTTDIEFVRRIYFDVIGRPPTPVQVEAFLHDHTQRQARPADRYVARQPGVRPQLGQLLA